MYEINDLQFKTREGSTDISIINEVVKGDCYNIDVKPGDIVIDIGGHIGSFTVWAASKGGNVYVFEPATKNYDILRELLIKLLSKTHTLISDKHNEVFGTLIYVKS